MMEKWLTQCLSDFKSSGNLFKSCAEWIVILKKLDDTKTNKGEFDIVDPNYARFRADKLQVVDIVNKYNQNKSIDKVINTYYKDDKIEYIKGEIVSVEFVDTCKSGIYYFEDYIPAFYLELPDKYTGEYFSWMENGSKRSTGNYINGVDKGAWRYWHPNGRLQSEGEYNGASKNGKWFEWHNNGKKMFCREYEKGFLNGKVIEWYYSGQKKRETTYVQDKIIKNIDYKESKIE